MQKPQSPTTEAQNIANSSIKIFVTRIFVFGATLVSGIIIARGLGPTGKGIIALLILLPTLLLRIGNFGLGAALIYYTGTKKYSLKTLTTNSVFMAMIIGFSLVLVFLIFFQPIYNSFFAKDSVNPLFVKTIICILPFQLILFYLSHNLLIQNKIRAYNIIELTTVMTNALLLVVLVIFAKLGVLGAIIAFFSSVMAPLVIAIIHTYSSIQFTLGLHLKAFVDSIKYGMKNLLTTLSDFMNYRADVLIMGYFLNAAQIGTFTVAIGLGELLWYIPNSIGTVLFPRISSVDHQTANEITAKICRISLATVIFCSIVLLVVAHFLIGLLYGQAFLSATQPLFILLPGIVTLSMTRLLSSDITGRGKPGIVASVSLSIAILNIALNIILIPHFQLMGAALSASISYIISGCVTIFIFSKISKVKIREILLLKRMDILEVISHVKSIIPKKQHLTP